MHTESHSPARLAVTFDDDRAVAGAGLALVATLSDRLGTFDLANEVVDLGDVRFSVASSDWRVMRDWRSSSKRRQDQAVLTVLSYQEGVPHSGFFRELAWPLGIKTHQDVEI